MNAVIATGDADGAAYAAIERIYHAYLTGLILMLASRAGPGRAAERNASSAQGIHGPGSHEVRLTSQGPG